jgi:hypothetical protein
MAAAQVFEQVIHTPHLALSVVDALARALRVGGEFPQPLGDISCEIVETMAPLQRTFDPPRVLWSFRNRSGYVVLDGTYTEANDRARRWPLGPGSYRIRVRGEYYQDGEFLLHWPPAADDRRIRIPQPNNADNLELLPAPAYPLPDVTTGRFQLAPTILRGSALRADGAPIQSALVEAINLPAFLQPPDLPPLGDWPFLTAHTSADGDWALVLPGRRYFDNAAEIPQPNAPPIRRQISVRIGYPSGPVTTVQDVLLGSEHSVRNTALRGQVLGPAGQPIAGAQIRTSASAATSTSRRDGIWFLYFDLNQVAVPNVAVTVTTPAGASATDSTAALQPRSTVVVPTFHFS